MKVVLIALSVRGAMGHYISSLAPHLAEKVKLHLFVPSHFSGEIGNAEVHCFHTGDSHLKALRRFLNPIAAWYVWSQIVDCKPDVIHLFNGEGYPWSLLFAHWAKKANIPLLVTVHDPEPHPGNVWEALNAKLRTYVLKSAKSVHVHAQCFADIVKSQGARDVEVIPHGSFAERFLRYKREGVRRERLALFFGRIEPYKGVETLVEAGIILGGRVKMVIAGPGRIPKRLKKKMLRHPEFFEMYNRYLSDEEVAHLFQRASVCVLPYKQATQSSLPLIAAAFGVPVVATAVGAFPEDVKRVNGIIVPPGDAESLARAIKEAMVRKPVYPAELEFNTLAKHFYHWYENIILGHR